MCGCKTKLDFPHLGGIAEEVRQVVDEGAGDIHEVAFCQGCRKSCASPEASTSQGEGVGEGGERLDVPRRAAKRGVGRDLGMGEEGHQGEEPEQGGCGAGDRAVGPLALRLDAPVRTHLAEGHLELPAQDEPGDDLQGIGGEVGAKQSLGGELPPRVAHEHPTDGDRRQPGVVPDGRAGEERDGPIPRAVPARDGAGRPGGRRVGRIGRQVGEAADLARPWRALRCERWRSPYQKPP